jgi:hypothetical protein
MQMNAYRFRQRRCVHRENIARLRNRASHRSAKGHSLDEDCRDMVELFRQATGSVLGPCSVKPPSA